MPAVLATHESIATVHREAVTWPLPAIAAYLQNHLGQQVTAYLSGLKDPKVVGRWIQGKSAPRESSQFRLREAYQACRLLILAYDDATARSWFFGTNALLGRAPAAALRTAETPEESQEVVAAAQSFVADDLGWREAAEPVGILTEAAVSTEVEA